MTVKQAVEIHIDGASRGNPGPSASGILIKDVGGKEILRRGEFLGETTNNVAEYTALLRALKFLVKTNKRNIAEVQLLIHSDSDLLINQLTGNYRIRSKNLMPLAIEARRLLKRFQGFEFKLINRKDNKVADKLANKAMNLMEDVDDL